MSRISSARGNSWSGSFRMWSFKSSTTSTAKSKPPVPPFGPVKDINAPHPTCVIPDGIPCLLEKPPAGKMYGQYRRGKKSKQETKASPGNTFHDKPRLIDWWTPCGMKSFALEPLEEESCAAVPTSLVTSTQDATATPNPVTSSSELVPVHPEECTATTVEETNTAKRRIEESVEVRSNSTKSPTTATSSRSAEAEEGCSSSFGDNQQSTEENFLLEDGVRSILTTNGSRIECVPVENEVEQRSKREAVGTSSVADLSTRALEGAQIASSTATAMTEIVGSEPITASSSSTVNEYSPTCTQSVGSTLSTPSAATFSCTSHADSSSVSVSSSEMRLHDSPFLNASPLSEAASSYDAVPEESSPSQKPSSATSCKRLKPALPEFKAAVSNSEGPGRFSVIFENYFEKKQKERVQQVHTNTIGIARARSRPAISKSTSASDAAASSNTVAIIRSSWSWKGGIIRTDKGGVAEETVNTAAKRYEEKPINAFIGGLEGRMDSERTETSLERRRNPRLRAFPAVKKETAEQQERYSSGCFGGSN